MSAGKHPPPWRWEEKGELSGLVAADGTEPLFTPLGRELIRLAPEMEAALRVVADKFMFEAGADGDEWNNRTIEEVVMPLLAALDAARKTEGP